MASVRIVTDTTAYLSKEEIEEYNIEIVPLYVNFPDEVIVDGSIPNAVFFDKVDKAAQLPFTSQPSPGDFVEVYEKILSAGDEIISIHISLGLSGTTESATAAKKVLDAEGISVIDSYHTTAGLAILVITAARAAKEGKSRIEIAEMLEEMKKRTQTFFIPATLDYLKKGGRIGGAQAFLGTILQIKPILYLNNGKIDAFTKVRTMKKALERIVEELPEKAEDVMLMAVMHAEAEETAAALKGLIQQRLPGIEDVMIYPLSPVIGTHTGPGVVGFSFIPK